MRKSVILCLAVTLFFSATLINAQTDLLKALQYRSIGPYRGGRSAAVAGVPSQPFVFYYGATGGGVWKSTDGGINWESISDGSVFGTGSVGAIAVADSDPNTIYVGMGESPIRGNVSRGDGVYKSTDAGKRWKRCGLEAPARFRAFAFIRRTPISFTSQPWATFGDRTISAACFVRK